MTDTLNPLLEFNGDIAFNRIRAEHVVPAVDVLLKEAREGLDAIKEAREKRSFDSVMQRLDHATAKLEDVMAVVGHLEAVSTYPEFRAAYNEAEPKVSAFFATIPLDDALWTAIKEYSETEEAATLTGERLRFLNETLADFRRNGADLDDARKKKLEACSVELARVTTQFSQNVLDATNAFELIIEDEGKLSGLPETAIEAARESAAAKAKTGYRFTLQAPSFIPLMTYLDDGSIRRHVYHAYQTRATEAPHDNRPLLTEILKLRNEKATLLGFRNFADLVLEDRMAKNGAAAGRFVAELREKCASAFERERLALHEFRKQLEGPDALAPAAWDVAYYAEKQRKALYEFDEEALRQYFPVDRVIDGMFTVAQRLYGVTIERDLTAPTWHDDVRCYRLRERSGEHLATFYVDLYPRESKRGGAWMSGLRTSTVDRAKHVAIMCANVSPGVGRKPALLGHRDVETLFHEFGHLLHHCLTRVTIRSLAGTRVAWDFVELPSQIMENWCWERQALDLFARHYQTQEPLPNDLFTQMSRARTYRAASAMMRQLGFAAVDLALHVEYEKARDGDVLDYARATLAAYAPSTLLSDDAMIASFGHLFAHSVGYAAGYYSYKWAEVLDADAFTRFTNAGIFDQTVGNEFRTAILERGNSEPPEELYRRFMGRAPSLDSLLIRSGLAA